MTVFSDIFTIYIFIAHVWLSYVLTGDVYVFLCSILSIRPSCFFRDFHSLKTIYFLSLLPFLTDLYFIDSLYIVEYMYIVIDIVYIVNPKYIYIIVCSSSSIENNDTVEQLVICFLQQLLFIISNFTFFIVWFVRGDH